MRGSAEVCNRVGMRLSGGLAALGALVTGAAVAWGSAAAVPKPPTAAVCVPTSIRMEYFSSLGPKLGEYNAVFAGLARVRPNDPYAYRCLWIDRDRPAGNNGAFQAILDITPAGLRGRVAAGDCGRNRPDSPPFYHSRKRYLTVDGTNALPYQNAVGGNEKVVKGVLAAAEAAGVGLPCQPAKPKPNPKPPPPPSPPKQPSPLPRPATSGSTTRCRLASACRDRSGWIEYHDTPAEIRPGLWRVNFTVERKDGKRCAGTLGSPPRRHSRRQRPKLRLLRRLSEGGDVHRGGHARRRGEDAEGKADVRRPGLADRRPRRLERIRKRVPPTSPAASGHLNWPAGRTADVTALPTPTRRRQPGRSSGVTRGLR